VSLTKLDKKSRNIKGAAMGLRARETKVVRSSDAQPICGATSKRSGKPCQVRILGRGGRCYLHGGASTGPRTEAGREQARRNALALNARRMAQRELQRAEQNSGQGVDDSKAHAAPVFTEADLQDDLQAVLRRVGSEHYGYATAHAFAFGKYSGRQRRPRCAKM
jgi:hypothetical protein